MKVTKQDLRRIIREAARQRRDGLAGPSEAGNAPTDGRVLAITKDLLASLIDEEYDRAMLERNSGRH